tara:strand:- start:358 stop:486 length:129 start_codon:yes stop_codon:yes gene_type:complete
MKKNKKPKWDGKSRISNSVYRRRFNEIFKKKPAHSGLKCGRG